MSVRIIGVCIFPLQSHPESANEEHRLFIVSFQTGKFRQSVFQGFAIGIKRLLNRGVTAADR
jgi:hypothetical protein